MIVDGANVLSKGFFLRVEEMVMETIKSECCEFAVQKLPASVGYCYVCRNFHEHQHLDLRSLKKQLLVRVGKQHPIHWDELCKDSEKLAAIKEGDFCQSLLNDLYALCSHGEPLSHYGQPLKIHTCYKSESVTTGLDFTTDICTISDTKTSGEVADVDNHLKDSVDRAAGQFKESQILRYEPSSVAFVAVNS